MNKDVYVTENLFKSIEVLENSKINTHTRMYEYITHII
jgi:hypothetical protein